MPNSYMSYEYMYVVEDALESIFSAGSFSSLVALASYVFSALAIYTIAQRREIQKAWLAWVPVANVWILGSISDQYRYVSRGEVRNKRKALLAVQIAQFAFTCAAVIKLIVSVVLAISGMAQSVNEMAIIRPILSSLVFFIPVLILGIVGLVLDILVLYDVYASCDPANNVLYLVLSLIPAISQITRPLFLFLCRNQDGGMPPRRETVQENPCEF